MIRANGRGLIMNDEGSRVAAMKHRAAIVRTEDGNWLAHCYEHAWYGDCHRTYTAACVDLSSHKREAKR